MNCQNAPESISMRLMRRSGIWEISAQIEIPISTIGHPIHLFKHRQSTASLPHSGRTCKISNRTARNIARKVKKNPRLTRSELQKDLKAAGTKVYKNIIRKVLVGEGLYSRTPRKTP